MKLKSRLVIYYLAATLLCMALVGFAVLKGIELLNMNTMEQQLIGESRLAEMYISQMALFENAASDGLSIETARSAIGNLSLSLGNIRLYGRQMELLAATQDSIDVFISGEENKKILKAALEGNYAYIVKNNTAYFASSLTLRNKAIGVLEIIYPLSFLSNLMSRVAGIFLAGAGLFALLMTLLGVYIAGRVTKPIKQLAEAAGSYANRDFTPVEIKSNDEIAQLCRSFNSMGARLKDYISRQKQFVSNVSHELKTPLTAIKGYSEYLGDEVKDNPDLQKAVYHLNNESERLARLVDEVLMLSRIDSDREEYEFKKLNFSSMIEEPMEKIKLKAEKYNITILSEIKPEVYILGDADKLVQVVVNLVDNAIKFSHANSQVWVRLYKENYNACFSVTDHGIGIPENEISVVFDRFYRASNSSGIPGTGLGLAIAKDIVHMHKGTIKLVSASLPGTTVILRLPLAQ